jgi:hypothetical protein
MKQVVFLLKHRTITMVWLVVLSNEECYGRQKSEEKKTYNIRPGEVGGGVSGYGQPCFE